MRNGRPVQSEEVYRQRWEARLIDKIFVCQETGCWIWIAKINKDGRGQVKIRINGKWTSDLAHREVYKVYRGPIPNGTELDHLCRVPCCVNPWHLEPVTHKVNSQRGMGTWPMNPRRTHCKRGHLLLEANLVHYEGRNRCRLCCNLRKRKNDG